MAGLRGALGLGKASPPHFQVEAYAPWRGTVALSDGNGNMYVYNPATGGYCLSNFREWWNPRRKIHQPPPGPRGSGSALGRASLRGALAGAGGVRDCLSRRSP